MFDSGLSAYCWLALAFCLRVVSGPSAYNWLALASDSGTSAYCWLALVFDCGPSAYRWLALLLDSCIHQLWLHPNLQAPGHKKRVDNNIT